MKKLILGPVRYAAERVFIPVIEESAETGETYGVCFVRLFSLVVVDREGGWVCPIGTEASLSDLISRVPELEHTLTMARHSLVHS